MPLHSSQLQKISSSCICRQIFLHTWCQSIAQERLEAAVSEAANIGEAAASEARSQLLAARREAGALREALDAALQAAEELRGALEARRVSVRVLAV